MKSTHTFFKLLTCLAFLQSAWLFEARAQLVDNDTTAAYIAAQCAISSGISADNYAAYAESLAKTMNMVSADDQEEIFGYVPMPSGALAGETEEALNEFQELLDEGEDDDDDDDDDGNSGSSWWDRILAWWSARFGDG